MIRCVFLRKSLSFGAAHIKKSFCMRDWANESVHAFSVVHGYHAISTYGQVHVRGEELQCQCEAGNVVRCFHCAMWSHAIFRDT